MTTTQVKKKPRSVRATLLAVRRLLVQKGWIQGDYRSKKGYCLVGALKEINGGYELRAKKRLRTFLPGSTWDGVTRRLVQYNDTPGRTKKEVLSLLTVAAKEKQEHE